ncbi:MAG: type II secretion system F family protein [Thermoproteota archaeon]|nr:type II secretion system F family protein [Thermoproteota archaeon]
MPKIERWEKNIAWIVSTSLGAAIIVTACLTFWRKPLFDEYLMLAVMVTVFPPAVLEYVNYRWKKAVDEHLPDLFRSIVQGQQTGMTLSCALEEASKRNYGPLTGELKKMMVQVSWGTPFEEALRALGKRVNTALVQRVVPLIIEAGRAGGRVEKVFAPTGKFIQATLTLEKERRTETRPYIAIVYVAFFVFLFTIIMLFKTFFVQVEGVPVLGAAVLTPQETRRIFFHMSLVQAFFGGLVAGKMSEGTVSAGLKHSMIMMVCGYLALKFVI